MYDYIHNFKKLGFGLFVHFGLYSMIGKGEWYLHLNPKASMEKYNQLPSRFNVKKMWARELVKTAKSAGCKYITLTTRHHDGFSLYDTLGLNNFDAPHSASARDLIKEFVSECKKENITPFFYHTLLDWNNPDYRSDFPKYIDYLVKSIEILCKNYGKIGGFWFDGMWDKPNEDWQEDRLYGMIRKYQPEAMIINNTGLNALGQTGHIEIDSVTFERGKPVYVDTSKKPIAGEMCQVMNDHWGYAKEDCNYKSVSELIRNLIDCRLCGCNFLLNTGLKGNGAVNGTDKCILNEVGKWVKANKEIIYDAVPVCADEIRAKNADVLKKDDFYYAIVRDVEMLCDENVAKQSKGNKKIILNTNKKIVDATWLDINEKVELEMPNSFFSCPFSYGTSLYARVAKFRLK